MLSDINSISCSNCLSIISYNSSFCTSCGAVQIKNSLIISKTTADYDPRSKDLKPWREPSLLATNSWKNRNLKVLVTKKEPWRPAMKQSRVYLKKGKGLPQLPVEEIIETKPIRNPEITSKIIVRYHGRLWSKTGDFYRKKKTVFSHKDILGLQEEEVEISLDKPQPYRPIVLYPLGIYPIDWIPYNTTTQSHSLTVHLTLLRRYFPSIHNPTTLLSTHWLRIGYGIESDSYSDYLILAYLPNSIAKCLDPSARSSSSGVEWVDLQYVDPSHSYMIDHLQVALSPLAYRVIPTLPKSLNISRFDQRSRVLARNLSSLQPIASSQGSLNGERDDDQSVYSTAQELNSLYRIHTLTEEDDEDHGEDQGEDQEEDQRECGDDDEEQVEENNNSPTEVTEEENSARSIEKINSLRFKFEACVARMVWGIPVGAYYLNRKILSTVCLEILWTHDKQESILLNNTNSESDSENEEEEEEDEGSLNSVSHSITPVNSSGLKPRRPKDWLTQGPFLEGVLLTIYPTYYNGNLVKPKQMIIHTESLCELISSETPKYLSTSQIEENSDDDLDLQSIYGENINPVSRHILRVLEKGSLGARYLCKQIIQVLRFEYTTEGLKLVVHGVEHNYTLISPPEAIDQQEHQKLLAIIKIQSVWRGKLGRNHVKELREFQNRIRELERYHAIVHIQRILRGYVARKRYLAILDALRKLPPQEEIKIIAPSPILSEEPIESIDEPIIVTIKGTEVEINLIPQVKNITNHFCDCLLIVTDILSKKSSSILILSSQLSRIWLSFKHLPLQFDEALIRLRHISLNDLKQVDLIGKNDPYVTIKLSESDWECSTIPVEEGGADVEWIITDTDTHTDHSTVSATDHDRETVTHPTKNEVQKSNSSSNSMRLSQELYQFPIKSSELSSKSLQILISDHNLYRSDVLIGETIMALSQLSQVTGYQEKMTITREIRKKGKGMMITTGYISITFDIYPTDILDVPGPTSQNSKSTKLKKTLQNYSDIKCVEEIVSNSQLKKEFLKYWSQQYLDLFLSRGNGVMILRLIGI